MKVIAVFDVGKTNKKVLLFNKDVEVVYQKEEKFPTITDEDGFECDDIELIEKWVVSTLNNIVNKDEYEVVGVNFSTYGASLAFIDDEGKRLTPIYNYLKPIDDKYVEKLFCNYGGDHEFCRKTASPPLGVMLNSGVQILWLKDEHPEVYAKTRSILHFPQYLSYLLTRQVVSESTSIGCHTYMWDYDKNKYHQWLNDEGIVLLNPIPNSYTFNIKINGKELNAGIGIHDSSASLVPYLMGSKDDFLLISTGTWCINMNPFNHTPLTENELLNDCLCYMSIHQKPVKSSRLFMGHIHDVNTNRLVKYYKVSPDQYKKVKTNEGYIKNILKAGESSKVFFAKGMPNDYIDMSVDLSQFASFDEAYHQFMFDLTDECAKSIRLVSSKGDNVKNFFVSGGFARNEIFVRLLGNFFPGKTVYTSEVDNSSALGAALVIWDKLESGKNPHIDLKLDKWISF